MLTIKTILDAAYYEVRIWFRLPDIRLFLAPEDLPVGILGGLFHSTPTLSESIWRFGIENAVRGGSYPTGHAEVVFHRMEYIVWEEARHPGYSRYR